MKFIVLTLFPNQINDIVNHSILKRAISQDIIEVLPIDIREFSKDKHKHVDDYTYGGGEGMVMKAEPIYDAFMSIPKELRDNSRRLYLSPQGRVFNQDIALEFSKEDCIIILCGHYEGVDERVLELLAFEEISIGDYVLTGGELASGIIIDATSRLISGVLGKDNSFINESFKEGLLEYPQYTRPEVFMGLSVPKVLLSGNHGRIEEWRREQSLLRTRLKRPDLLGR